MPDPALSRRFPSSGRPLRRAGLLLAGLALLAPVPASAVAPGPVGNVALFNPELQEPASDAFGQSIASGDFNDDGIADLAVADRAHSGLVRIYYGTVWEIGAPSGPPFLMETVTVPTVPGTSGGLPTVLAAGDFGHDASDDDDLVVGVPGDSLSANHAGAVFVLDRAPGGGWSVIDVIRQGFEGYVGISEADDQFGAALAVGDFDVNGAVDLAIGIPGETTQGEASAGAVMVVPQGVAGLYPDDASVFYRGFNGLTGVPEAGEQIGYALAPGDFDGDDATDLAIGIPGASCAGFANSGSVMVLRSQGFLVGLGAAGVSYWSQAQAGMAGGCETGDRFGSSLAAGYFDPTPLGDPPTQDLAIGVPGEEVQDVPFAGAVALVYGSAGGLVAEGNQLLTEADFPGGALEAAAFGVRLASGRLTGSPLSGDALVVTSPLASEGGLALAGRAWYIPAGSGGLAPARARRLWLSPAMAAGPAAANDAFGAQLAIGDFNGDSDLDIAFGVPGNDAVAADSGAVQVVYQSDFLFVDGFD
jgi:hypothetical protein